VNSTAPAADVVLRLDAIAATFVRRAAPLRFGVAEAPRDIAGAYRVRYEVVVARGWAEPVNLLDGFERDANDDDAVQIVGWDRDCVVATGRLVLPAPGRRLPTEEAFGVELASRERLVDVGRVCVAPAYGRYRHGVFRGLLGQIWLEMRRRGFQEACAAVNAQSARLYRWWGFRVSLLGPSRSYWGQERYPIRMSPPEAVKRLG
jgi:hypothetical protein